ncbi:trypsin-like serine protease [Neoconidiobolus thromboides FSU 785]|nr:trypsin-like serine protease [Neoconidiobolus thromboides FSU 785]
MKLSIYLLFLGLVSAANLLSNDASIKLVGGTEVSPKFKYPWIVSLNNQDTHICGGTLINSNTIITNAGCIYGNITEWTAKIHRHDLSLTELEENGKTFSIKSWIAHPLYSRSDYYDISLWKLDGNFNLSTIIQLDQGDLSNTEKLTLKIIGWGATQSGDGSIPLLREIHQSIVNNEKCKSRYSYFKKELLFCASNGGYENPCYGDQGSPLFLEDGNTFTLVGLSSISLDCGARHYPHVYTRVSSLLPFIQKHINF